MITDYLSNLSIYSSLNKNLALGIQFLLNNPLKDLVVGKYEIDGDNVFAIISEYTTKPSEEGKWEAHIKYIDIQHVISGQEMIGFSPLSNMSIHQPYNDEKDYTLFSGNGVFLEATPLNFFVFYPQDVHMPGIINLNNEMVKKIVVKVKLDL